MIAQRFKPIGWVVGVAVAILLLYVIQLQVANERGKLKNVDTEIALVRKDIRRLQTEFQTRASMRQLERWNGTDQSLALSAPQARQYLRGEDSISDLGEAHFKGTGSAPPPAAVMASIASDVPPPLPAQTVQVTAPIAGARPKSAPVIVDKAKPVTLLSSRDREAQRALSSSDKPASHPKDKAPIKLASAAPAKARNSSALDHSLIKAIDRGAAAELSSRRKPAP